MPPQAHTFPVKPKGIRFIKLLASHAIAFIVGFLVSLIAFTATAFAEPSSPRPSAWNLRIIQAEITQPVHIEAPFLTNPTLRQVTVHWLTKTKELLTISYIVQCPFLVYRVSAVASNGSFLPFQPPFLLPESQEKTIVLQAALTAFPCPSIMACR